MLLNQSISRTNLIFLKMERTGYISFIEDYLNLPSNTPKRQQLLKCHQQCGDDRWACLTPSDRQFFMDHADIDRTVARMKNMIQRGSGIAGTDYLATVNEEGIMETVSIKCLHTHYAHFRSTTATATATTRRGLSKDENDTTVENPIGRIVEDILSATFTALVLWACCWEKSKSGSRPTQHTVVHLEKQGNFINEKEIDKIGRHKDHY